MSYQLQSKILLVNAAGRKPLTKGHGKAARGESRYVKVALTVGLFAAHVPLALLMSRNSNFATLHVLATVGVGLYFAVSKTKLYQVAYLSAYITGAEVLWRMTGAQVFWEAGKYATVLVLLVAMVRYRKFKPQALPMVYFVLLLPSVILTAADVGWHEARMLISGNLSGPFALTVAACFFSQLKLSPLHMRQILLAAVAPVFGIAVIAFFGIASAEDIVFTAESNSTTSGGFGPNQVSSVLGLGALLCLFLILHPRVGGKAKLGLGAMMIFLATQSALTFSRGGLYTAAGAVILASFYLLRDARARIQFAIVTALLLVGLQFVILPRLNDLTDGALAERFQDTGLTNRDRIFLMDLEIWAEHPMFGVGPGIAKYYRADLGVGAIAHTEFSRLVAEHGVFGLAALIVLLFAAARNLVRARGAKEKAYVTAFTGWSCLYMLNAAMRLAAPCLMFGLAFAQQGDEAQVKRRTAPVPRQPVRRGSPRPVLRAAPGAKR